MKITTPALKKLDDRNRRTIFVGYEPGSKAYRLYDPTTRRVHISRDVVFDEGAQWKWSNEMDDTNDDFIIEEEASNSSEVISMTTSSSPPVVTASTPATSPPSPASAPPNLGGSMSLPLETPPHAAGRPVEFATPPGSAELDLDADHDDDAPLRFRHLDNVGPTSPPVLADRREADQQLLASDVEPTTYEEAQKHEHWRNAMLDEITMIEANQTWELVDPPPHCCPIGLKWVYKAKKDTADNISKYKGRLVAKGYVQQQGVDFDEVFALVARLESVRLLLAHAANEGWAVHQMDVKSAFLNGELLEEVYVQQPPGFVLKGHEGKVLRLVKALYGLRQAPRAWYSKLDGALLQLGFRRSSSEHAVYFRGAGTRRLVIGVYVDDLVITGGNQGDIDQFKEEMKSMF
jgi:hypothetical protein